MVRSVSGQWLGIEVRKLGLGAHIVPIDVCIARAVEDRAAVAGEIDMVCASIRYEHSKGVHQVPGRIEFEDVSRAVCLANVHGPCGIKGHG